MTRPPCRHCRRRVANPQKRGLCWTCYNTPGLRDQYPSTSKYARRGTGRDDDRADPAPTATLPGTPERIEALAARAAAGERLFHPDDATWELT